MDVSWWNRALAPEVVIPSVLALIVGLCAVWYARRGPVPGERQRDFAVSLRQIKIFVQPVTRTDEFEFTFRGKSVCEVAQYRLVFANTGYEAIVRKDFDQPLTLQLEGNGDVFDCAKAVCRPAELNVEVHFHKESNSLVIAPLLLNPGDFGSVDFITTNRPETRIGVRIRGINAFHPLTGGIYDSYPTTFPATLFIVGIVVASMPWWGRLLVKDEYRELFKPRADWSSFMFLIFGLIVMLVAVKMYRSTASLRRARYLGHGTEPVFFMTEKEPE